jgi:hypothetical protein
MPQIEVSMMYWMMKLTDRHPSFLSETVDNAGERGENPNCHV